MNTKIYWLLLVATFIIGGGAQRSMAAGWSEVRTSGANEPYVTVRENGNPGIAMTLYAKPASDCLIYMGIINIRDAPYPQSDVGRFHGYSIRTRVDKNPVWESDIALRVIANNVDFASQTVFHPLEESYLDELANGDNFIAGGARGEWTGRFSLDGSGAAIRNLIQACEALGANGEWQ